MTDDEFVRYVQRLAGLRQDGIPGPMTQAAVARAFGASTVPPVAATGLVRIVFHWTAGTHTVSSTDRQHYHFIIGGDGKVVTGVHKPEDNISTADGHYAAHTRSLNTGSIGVAMAGMHGAVERPFSAGGFPLRDVQVDALVALLADLCRRYRIPVTPRTVLSHAEVQPTLGVAQAGKWDVCWLPGMNAPQDPVSVGNIIRNRVSAIL